MTIEKGEENFLNQLLRYSLWTIGGVGVLGIAVFLGTSLNAYNNESSWGCVWEYEEDTTLEIPYRFHPMSDAYQDAYDDALDACNDSDTSVDFDFDNYQIHHNMGVRNEPHDEVTSKSV